VTLGLGGTIIQLQAVKVRQENEKKVAFTIYRNMNNDNNNNTAIWP